jgi:hypothetical protein
MSSSAPRPAVSASLGGERGVFACVLCLVSSLFKSHPPGVSVSRGVWPVRWSRTGGLPPLASVSESSTSGAREAPSIGGRVGSTLTAPTCAATVGVMPPRPRRSTASSGGGVVCACADEGSRVTDLPVPRRRRCPRRSPATGCCPASHGR